MGAVRSKEVKSFVSQFHGYNISLYQLVYLNQSLSLSLSPLPLFSIHRFLSLGSTCSFAFHVFWPALLQFVSRARAREQLFFVVSCPYMISLQQISWPKGRRMGGGNIKQGSDQREQIQLRGGHAQAQQTMSAWHPQVSNPMGYRVIVTIVYIYIYIYTINNFPTSFIVRVLLRKCKTWSCLATIGWCHPSDSFAFAICFVIQHWWQNM